MSILPDVPHLPAILVLAAALAFSISFLVRWLTGEWDGAADRIICGVTFMLSIPTVIFWLVATIAEKTAAPPTVLLSYRDFSRWAAVLLFLAVSLQKPVVMLAINRVEGMLRRLRRLRMLHMPQR